MDKNGQEKKDTKREYFRKWREAHPGYAAKYRAEHPDYRDKNAEQGRKWREDHPDYMNRWRDRNRERARDAILAEGFMVMGEL